MSDNQKIISHSADLFAQQCYAEGFSELWKLGATEFAAHILNVRKKKIPGRLREEKPRKYFWTAFVHRPDVRYEVFRTKYAGGIISNYFEFFAADDSGLLVSLAQEFPDLILESVRTNRIFLREEWKGKLILLKTLPLFKPHSVVWERIQDGDEKLWNRVETHIPPLNDYKIHQLLADVVIWLELERFGRNTIHNIHFLARVYSFFIEKILPVTEVYRLHVSLKQSDEFAGTFGKQFRLAFDQRKTYTTPVSKILTAVTDWLSFIERTCEQYSFNLQIQPVLENKSILFRSSPHECNSDHVDAVRYEVVQAYYHHAGEEATSYAEKTGKIKIQKGLKSGDEQINRVLSDLKFAAVCALNDLCIEKYSSTAGDFHVMEVLSPLLTYSINRRERYEQAVVKHSQNSATWFEAYANLVRESVQEDILKEPYIFTDCTELQKLNLSAVGASIECTSAIIELFGFTPLTQFAAQRHSYRYDVWNNPLLKIGNELFCPMMFFASNMWFYSFIQNALLSKARDTTNSPETERMEAYLGQRFSHEREWTVKVVSKQEASRMDGDVDLIVQGSDRVLLIQLKRTYLRLNVKDTFTESTMIDQKAADQLCKAEAYLQSENAIYQLKQKCRKWIVTTSLENIQSEINGCRKISYFELLMALGKHEIKNLDTLIRYVEGDEHLKIMCETAMKHNTSDDIKQFIEAIGLPIKVFEPKAYSVPIMTDDEHASEQYVSVFNSALDKDRKEEKNSAITLFHQCTELNPSDPEAWYCLANCLADTRQFSQSITCFEKALRLLPDDPFITRNYVLTLMESGDYFNGMSKLIDLYEMYPLMSTLKRDIAGHFRYGTQQNKMNRQELEIVMDRVRRWVGEEM